MSKIIIYGQICEIQDEDDCEFLRNLDEELSFEVLGHEFMAGFKKGFWRNGKLNHWDGKQNLLSRDLRFARGLLQRVLDFYKAHNKEVEIEDHRPPQTISEPIDISSRLKEMGKEPYYYQIDALEAAKNSKNNMGILKLSTGAGKSLLVAMMCAYFNKPTIVFVVGKSLLFQLHNFFSEIFNDRKIGIIGDGLCDIVEDGINIATVWSCAVALGDKYTKAEEEESEKKLDENKYVKIQDMLKKVKVEIFDECHLVCCSSIEKINSFTSTNSFVEKIFGCSASPWRDDKKDLLLEAMLGHRIIDIPASQLISEGFLVKPYIKFIPVPAMPGFDGKGSEYKTIYKQYICDNPVRNLICVQATQKLVEAGYKTLVLYNTIEHGKTLYSMISEKMSCALLSGKDSEEIRDQTLKDINDGKIKCIIASKIFDLGVDAPSLSGLVNCGGGKSSIRILQKTGRIIRRFPGKNKSAMIDFIDNCKYLDKHSRIRFKTLSTFEKGFDVQWLQKKK
jgi:superfamily II DNA or RNA helicase